MRKNLFALGIAVASAAFLLMLIGAVSSMDPPWLSADELERLRKQGLVLFSLGGLLALATATQAMVLKVFGRP